MTPFFFFSSYVKGMFEEYEVENDEI